MEAAILITGLKAFLGMVLPAVAGSATAAIRKKRNGTKGAGAVGWQMLGASVAAAAGVAAGWVDPSMATVGMAGFGAKSASDMTYHWYKERR